MSNDTLKFFQKVDENKSTFFVSAQTISNPSQKISTIRLDKEDMEYLMKKYRPILKEEMEENITEIKNQYKELL